MIQTHLTVIISKIRRNLQVFNKLLKKVAILLIQEIITIWATLRRVVMDSSRNNKLMVLVQGLGLLKMLTMQLQVAI